MSLISPEILEKKILGKKILIDTNIIIYLLEEVEEYAELSRLV